MVPSTRLVIISYQKSFKKEVERLAKLSFKSRLDAFWASKWIDRCDKAFLAVLDSRVIGVVELGLVPLKAGLHSQIGYIFVHPEYRRQGIGTMLVEKSISFLNSVGGVGVWAVTSRDNVAAQRLFERSGFKLFKHPNELIGVLDREDVSKLLRKLYYEKDDLLFFRPLDFDRGV